ncbi:MAG: hypothetical protein HZA61_03245 [Candidatus Eisenbacteria bacterium]|uniref:Uncharacterized protein n=1 Tax=Eiseniibacteriota bacterium TaxID=2212470 RepID=A0A933SB02_UNCEI|nr:hypothetical protein [Candidatus Eisenbacteria bacterium]
MHHSHRIAPLPAALLVLSLLVPASPVRAQDATSAPETGDGVRKFATYMGCAAGIFTSVSVGQLLVVLTGCLRILADELEHAG